MSSRPNIAIIGAGISGLSAAHVLRPHCDVKLFDKSRGTGGRMSTRYAGSYEFDHGAQYFTINDAGFRKAVDTAVTTGAAALWQGRAIYLKSGNYTKDTGGERYVGTPRMNSLPKFLAQNLDVTLARRVSNMVHTNNQWALEFETGEVEHGFEAVICTAPPAQAEDILPENFCDMETLKSAKMQACFALMIGLPDMPDFGWDSLRLNDGPLAWMAVNSAKPNRNSDVSCLVIHADAMWSEENQDADRVWVQSHLIEAASQICNINLRSAAHIALHRWLYASVENSPAQDCLFDPALNLAACGDWCLGGRVEGAWCSGQAAGLSVLNALNISP